MIADEFAALGASPKYRQHRIDPPAREWLRDGVGIQFEGWTCFHNPETRSSVSFDPEMKRFFLVVDGVAEMAFPNLKAVFQDE